MGEAGYNRVKNELTWDRIVLRMADVLYCISTNK